MAGKQPSLVEIIAANVKSLREEAGYTQRQLAREASKRSKIDPKSISNLERGEFTPKLETIEAIAAVFGKDPWQLLRPGAIEDPLDNDGKRLVAMYTSAPPAGRVTIMQVAEMAGRYGSGDMDVGRTTAQKP